MASYGVSVCAALEVAGSEDDEMPFRFLCRRDLAHSGYQTKIHAAQLTHCSLTVDSLWALL